MGSGGRERTVRALSPLGGFVKERRRELGLSQGRLEARAGLAPGTVSNVELGRSALPVADHRRRLARALGVGHAELLVAAGELSADEVVAAAGTLGVSSDEGRPPLPAWLEDVAARAAETREASPRARLMRAVVQLTSEEAASLLAVVETLGRGEAAKNREEMDPEQYRAWRGPLDRKWEAKELL